MKSGRVILGAAIALVSASCCAPAFAQCVASDSLQLGDHPPVVLCEGSPEGFANGGQAVDSIDLTPVPVSPITTDLQITLTEPGSSTVSDFVNVDPLFFVNVDGVTILDGLDVTLVSDTEVPLPVSFGQVHIPETGAVQNLDPLITNFYGWTFTIPAVNVMSDVPEPSTWAMMLLGFAGLGFARHRARQHTAALAA
jgi:PEP-CTERM motif